MIEDGTIIQEAYAWFVDFKVEPPTIHLRNRSTDFSSEVHDVYRFGAYIVDCPLGIVLVGGLCSRGLPSQDRDIVSIQWTNLLSDGFVQVQPLLTYADQTPLVSPLFVGHSAVWDGKGIAVVGGGAVCFSFGSNNNQHVWRLNLDLTIEGGVWKYQGRDLVETAAKKLKLTTDDTTPDFKRRTRLITPIPRRSLDSRSSFLRAMHKSTPFVIEGLDIGPCTERWTTQYLKRHVGPSRKVIIHRARERAMVFQSQERNFEYETSSFDDFMDAVAAGERQYFRALAASDHKKPANFHEDFAGIAQDFTIPSELTLISKQLHSSVLRISGPVAMWLHYDVCVTMFLTQPVFTSNDAFYYR